MPFDLAVTDKLLSTTRAVRRRLDLTRAVERGVILDCVRLSQQAPTGSNQQGWRWMVVAEPGKKAALAGLDGGRVLRLDLPGRVELSARAPLSWSRQRADDAASFVCRAGRGVARHPGRRHAVRAPSRRVHEGPRFPVGPAPAARAHHLLEHLEGRRRIATRRQELPPREGPRRGKDRRGSLRPLPRSIVAATRAQ